MVQISQENIEITKDRIGNITTSIGNADFHREQVWKCRNCDYRLVIQQDNNVNDYVFLNYEVCTFSNNLSYCIFLYFHI